MQAIQVSAIVPVYNEEKTVLRVIRPLLTSRLIDEVVAVNDGSTDSSLRILKDLGTRIKLINLKKNCGKGRALAEGIKRSRGQVVAFFDADLTNLNSRYISQLLSPLKNRTVAGVIGILTTKNSLPIIFPPFSGIRAYRKKELGSHLKEIKTTKYGAEAFLNKVFKERNIRKVNLKGLKYLRKPQKHSRKKALKEYLKMYKEIAQEMVK